MIFLLLFFAGFVLAAIIGGGWVLLIYLLVHAVPFWAAGEAFSRQANRADKTHRAFPKTQKVQRLISKGRKF